MTLSYCQFKTDNASLEYIEAGHGSVVLLLHGLGYRGRTYKNIIDQLSQSYHVYAPSLHFSVRGQSISSFEDYAALLREFIQTKHLKHITLIGHSLGGGVAMRLAESNEELSRLILIGSIGLPMPYSFSQLLYLLITKTWHELKYKKQLSTLVRLVWDFSLFTVRSLPQFSRTEKAIADITSRELIQFHKIQLPTFLLWGKHDEFFPLAYAEQLQAKLFGSKLTVVEGNHDLMLFRCKEFGELVDGCI